MPATRSLLQAVFDHSAFRAVGSPVSERRSPVTPSSPALSTPTLCGLTQTGKAIVVAGLAHQLGRTVIVLTAAQEVADRLQQTASTALEWLEPGAGSAVGVLPAWDGSPYENRSPHAEVAEQRALALWNLASGRTRLLLVPLPAALARFRERAFYASLAVELKVGDELGPNDLLEHLGSVGYEPGEPVQSVGQYSIRGGIVDVFSPEADWPFRIEFFGDRIESLRQFDSATQRSRRPVTTASLLPLSERKRSPGFFQALVQELARRATGARQGASPTEREPDWAAAHSGPFPGWEYFGPLVEPHPNTLFSLAERPVVVWDEKLDRGEQLRHAVEAWAEGYEEVRDTVPPRPRPEDITLSEAEFWKSVEGVPQIGLKELALEVGEGLHGPPTLSPPAEAGARHGAPQFALPTQPTPKFHGDVKGLIENLRARLAKRESVAFVLPTTGKLDRLQEILKEYEIPFTGADVRETAPSAPHHPDPSRGQSAGGVETAEASQWAVSTPALLARGEMAEGVEFPELGLVLLADGDLFGSFDWGPRRRREHSGASSFISSLGDLRQGDYVVHVDHGIGIYQGLRQLSVEGRARDFMLLTYHDDAKLYVPLERLDLVEKYRSGDGAKPQLDRLGGATWERTKSRVKRALRDMAAELLHLYAERKMRGGTASSADSPWQKEFEDAFPFEETPDQLTALADIKRDLESPMPMDRLLCGDVGYGKTELAMRAALKVVQDSRQVAVLAPTTVLAFQHFSTFRQRMAPFPVRIEMLSRFRSAAEQKKIVAETEAGKVDILIGTHRLLSKDVSFRDLGLLVVDEEQRFGVAAKERLKKIKAGVDVLTMSATPIPRTLHMSLGGLRDLSVIETPPRGRLAIQTTVAPFNQSLIQAAILQEMERQGQVYFVHNRVESIFGMAALVQKLVPTARIGVAHGQMAERELERVMLKFMQGEYDVLASTALIENGLDIPRANTILVNHADRFGLADLYQLRGRVGRSNRRAYAYFLIPAEESLPPIAKRRLAALKEFSDLGAGFRLAALDLELRGAGNVLGAEQSGHLNAIGIDLYLKMLDETVEELKGSPARPEVHTTLNLGLDIRIPEGYVADESERLRLYKRISSLASSEARADLEAELVDRYGPLPASVTNLLDYALLKSAAEGLLVQSIEKKGEEIWMRFHEQAPVDARKLAQFVRARREAVLRPDGLLRFRLREPASNPLPRIQNVLQELQAGH